MSDAATLSVVVNGKDAGLTALLTKIEGELKQTGAAAQRNEQETLALAQAYARLAQQLGQPAVGAATLRNTLQGLTTVTTRQAAAVQSQIASLDRSADAARRGGTAFQQLSSTAASLSNGLGAIGVGVGLQQLLSFGTDAAQSALGLQKVQNALQALSGSQENYANIMATAREQQALFGGTLEENLSSLTAFVVQAKASGAPVNQLIDLSQRLATFDPGQGLEGASAAMRELLAGNPGPLAARFELPKAALAGIRDEAATTADRLKILDDVLNNAGITSELVSGSVSESARAYNELGAAADNAKVAIGAGLAQAFTGPAQAATGFFNDVANGLNSFGAIGDQQQQLNAQLASGQITYDQYRERLAAVNAEIARSSQVFPGLAGAIFNNTTQIQPLTQQQFALAQAMAQSTGDMQGAIAAVTQYSGTFAQLTPAQQAFVQSLAAQGVGLQQAIQQAQGLAPALNGIAQAQQGLVTSGIATEQTAARIAQRLTAVAQAGGPAGASVAGLVAAYNNGTIGAGTLQKALEQLEAAQAAETNAAAQASQRAEERSTALTAEAAAAQQTATAASALIAELTTEAEAKQAAADKAELLAQLQADLAGISAGVAGGLITSGDGALQLADKYGIASAEAERLINLQAQLAGGAGRIAAQNANTRDNTGGRGVVAGAPGRRGQTDADIFATIARTEAANAAQRRYNETIGGQAVQLANVRRELAQTVEGTEQYYDLKTKEAQLTASARGGGGGGGGGGRATAAQREAGQLEQIEADHQDRLAEIARDGAERRAQADAEYAARTRRGRISFYRQLADIEDQATAQRLSAQFEAAQQEAEQIRQTQGADAAQAYLDAATAAIQAQQEIQDEIDKANEAGDKGKAEYLQGILAMQKAADNEELNAIKTKGSAIAAEQAAQYAEAEAAYAAHLDKLAATYQAKAATTPGLATTLPTAEQTRAAAQPASTATGAGGATTPPPRGPQPVTDVETQQTIVDAMGRVEAAITTLIGAIGQGFQGNQAALGEIRSALGNLRQGVV